MGERLTSISEIGEFVVEERRVGVGIVAGGLWVSGELRGGWGWSKVEGCLFRIVL